MSEGLLNSWIDASEDLGVEIVPSFTLNLSGGIVLNTVLLVRDFGAKNGMLIISDFSEVKPYLNEIVAADYGFCVLDEPSVDSRYDRDSYIEMLRDWTWSGKQYEKPSWL